MAFDYDSIKVSAKNLGLRVTDLLALAPQNDPFYAGTPAGREQAQWFADIWKRARYFRGVHLRRVHYWIVSQSPAVLLPNGKPYENTENCWKYLDQASKMARYLSLIGLDDIIDNKNPPPHIYAPYSDDTPTYSIETPEIDDPYIYIYGIENVNAQPYHLEVWCEKSTMNDVLLPVCQRYHANLATFEGEVSVTACKDLVRRISTSGGKPTRLWYISDFDPAGNSMPVAQSRKVEWVLQHEGHPFDVQIASLALTIEQIQQYSLPRPPIKETEKRAARFEEAHGEGAVELDALEALYPGVLARIVGEALSGYYSEAAERETAVQREALRQAISVQIEAITDRYSDEIEAIRGMIEELEQIEIDAGEYAVSRFEPTIYEPDGWLFDSRRDYVTQIAHYKAHKGKP